MPSQISKAAKAFITFVGGGTIVGAIVFAILLTKGYRPKSFSISIGPVGVDLEPPAIQMSPTVIKRAKTPTPKSGQPTVTRMPTNTPQPVVPPTIDGERIVFVSDRNGSDDVYLMSSTGTGQTQLTHNLESVSGMVWSPDGKRVAFNTFHGIYVMNVDGTGLAHILDSGEDPTWSPDGKSLVYWDISDDWNICVIKADGTGKTYLTNDSVTYWLPKWSPDGRQIAFLANKASAVRNIYVMNADGTGQQHLTTGSVVTDLAWSADGKKLVFSSAPDYVSQTEIYVVQPDGTNRTQLTNNTVYDESPRWSPDGRLILFASGQGSKAKVCIMNANGSGQACLANGFSPGWSSDGTRIVFVSDRDGDSEIYVMNMDGTNQTQLTNNSADDLHPIWSP